MALPAQTTSVFGSQRLTGALLDRLFLRHAHILEMNGESYRLNQSKRRPRPTSSDTPTDNYSPRMSFTMEALRIAANIARLRSL